MITFERTTDDDLIKSIRTHPKIWPAFADDFTAAPEASYSALDTTQIGHLLVKYDGVLAGMFIFIPHNRICWEIHTCLLPDFWGRKAFEIASALAAWVWKETSCMKVFTVVPAYNRTALAFSRRAGFVQFGLNERSIMKHGKLQDQVMLGISRPQREQ